MLKKKIAQLLSYTVAKDWRKGQKTPSASLKIPGGYSYVAGWHGKYTGISV